MLRLFIVISFAGLCAGTRAAPNAAQLEAARALFDDRTKAVEAQQAFEQLVAVDPNHPEINRYLGRLALRRDDGEKAVSYFEKAIVGAPNAAVSHHDLGNAYGIAARKASLLRQLGIARKCKAAYELAIALEPTNIDYRMSLLQYCRQAPGIAGGGTDQAMIQAVEIKKLDSMRGHIAFATIYAGEKKYAEAFSEFEAALKAKPDDFVALYQIGRLAAMSGEHTERGMEMLRRCLELTPPENHPGHAAVHWRIGNLHEKKGDPTAARASYEAALKFDPEYGPATESLKKLGGAKSGE